MIAIYRIFRLGDSRLYIGSATDPVRRKNRHWRSLREGKHHCIHLQRAFKKYGEANFIFEVIEWVDDLNGLSSEQKWIDFYQPQGLYNTYLTAGSPTVGGRLSDEHRAKISNGLTGKVRSQEAIEKSRKSLVAYYAKPENRAKLELAQKAASSPESVRKSSEARTGKKYPQIAASLSRSWPGLVSPDGQVYDPIVNMAAFCREHGLLLGNVMKLLKGQLHHTRGWKRVHPPSSPSLPSRSIFQ